MADALDLSRSEFDALSEARWRELAEASLGGQSLERLTRKTPGGLETRPLYTQRGEGTAAGPVFGPSPHNAVGLPWRIGAIVRHPDPAEANKEILRDLERGVNAITLSAAPGADFTAMLKGVLTDIAPVGLEPDCFTPATAEALAAALPASSASAFEGCFGAAPIEALARRGQAARDGAAAIEASARLAADLARRFPKARAYAVDGSVVHEAGGSDIQELAFACALAAADMNAMLGAGLSAQEAAGQLQFRLAVDADIFAGIAKLRAARLLWARMVEAYGVSGPAARADVHAASSARMLTRYDAWSNLLRNTQACFAAACGGADMITVRPFTDALGLPAEIGRRTARNIQLILMEESRLGHVADPAAGSFFAETRTGELAAAAWALFQDMERAGGALAVVESGWLAERVAAVRTERASLIARRKEEIIGVSAYPLLGERQAETAGPNPPASEAGAHDAPLAPSRLAAPFEALRDRAEAAAERPEVFLANLGRLADFSARAHFAANLFAAAGVGAASAETGHDEAGALGAAAKASGLKAACLCGADEAYAQHAEAAARALKEAGAAYVLLAGRPGESEAALRAAGVDDFVFMGCDALEALARLHRALGL